ncbi:MULTISPECIES: hypothetical protein [unclassified Campylobacter]|uniref:hypothetical protein n=1 Tax=unclassified Campylobacter TaxID=2593542 RepID=UPI0022E9D794|nr:MULTISPECIES: hypothetical protein [unclassified Campylobacter]MDA3062008.1 hypothetical protein [Campylobacter sp. JMF_14 EL1]MDA3072887.1 hypothetical protein [Campylobacter sp. JMF_10 EL2]
MDILIVNLIVAFACALCIRYIKNSQINKSAKTFFIVLFLAFIFFGFFVFVFFLTFIFLFIISRYEFGIQRKAIKAGNQAEATKKICLLKKTQFITILTILFLTYGFVFDGFKILKFEYECNIKKDFKIEIVSDDYEIKESDYMIIKKDFPYTYTSYPDSNISFLSNDDLKSCYYSDLSDLAKKCGKSGYRHTADIFYQNNLVAKKYEYFMPYNYFMAKMQSIETSIHYEKCGYGYNEIIDILKQNLINKNSNEKGKR